MTDEPPCLIKLREMREQVAARAQPKASPELAKYLDKVRRWAYKVTDEEVAALLAAGLTQDEIYEATMHAAMTAGIDRFDIGLRALRGVK